MTPLGEQRGTNPQQSNQTVPIAHQQSNPTESNPTDAAPFSSSDFPDIPGVPRSGIYAANRNANRDPPSAGAPPVPPPPAGRAAAPPVPPSREELMAQVIELQNRIIQQNQQPSVPPIPPPMPPKPLLPKPSRFSKDSESLKCRVWLNSMTVYLDLLGETRKVQVAVQFLEGDALLWWQSVGKQIPNVLSWIVFAAELVNHCTSGGDSRKARNQLLSLTQGLGETVDKYCARINTILQRITVGSLPDPSTLADYVHQGLLPEIVSPLASRLSPAQRLDVREVIKAATQIDANLRSDTSFRYTKKSDNPNSKPTSPVRGNQQKTNSANVQGHNSRDRSSSRGRPSHQQSRGAPKQGGPSAERPAGPLKTSWTRTGNDWPNAAEQKANKTVWASNKACLVCGLGGHWARECRSPFNSYVSSKPTSDCNTPVIASGLHTVPDPAIVVTNLFSALQPLQPSRMPSTLKSSRVPSGKKANNSKNSKSKPTRSHLIFPCSLSDVQKGEGKAARGAGSQQATVAESISVSGSALLDTGADANYISHNVVTELEVPLVPSVGKVRMGDGTIVSPAGTCRLALTLGNYTEVLDFIVLYSSHPLYQVALGLDWQIEHDLDILLSVGKCRFRHKKGKTELQHVTTDNNIPKAPTPLCEFNSAT